MNKGGYIITHQAVLLSIVILLIASYCFIPLGNASVQIKEDYAALKSYCEKQVIAERLQTIFKKNISYSVKTYYDDIPGQIIDIQELESRVEPVVITDTTWSEKQYNIPIYNATSIKIIINPELGGTCNAVLYTPDGTVIVSETISQKREWNISNIYDPETDIWGMGYGNYTLVVEPENADIDINIEYNKVVSRKVEVTGKNFSRIFNIVNREGTNEVQETAK